MEFSLNLFENIGENYGKVLKIHLGIESVDDFIQYSIQEISDRSGIEESRIREWAEIFDLLRIPHISIRDAELLHAIRITSIYELAHAQAVKLLYKIDYLDKQTYLIVFQKPSLTKIEAWIQYAKLLVINDDIDVNIPLILFPMINYHRASLFGKFNIYTLHDFDLHPISQIRKRVGFSKQEYKDFLQLSDLVRVKGIDLSLALVFRAVGLTTIYDLDALSTEEILTKIRSFRQKFAESQNHPSETWHLSSKVIPNRIYFEQGIIKPITWEIAQDEINKIKKEIQISREMLML